MLRVKETASSQKNAIDVEGTTRTRYDLNSPVSTDMMVGASFTIINLILSMMMQHGEHFIGQSKIRGDFYGFVEQNGRDLCPGRVGALRENSRSWSKLKTSFLALSTTTT